MRNRDPRPEPSAGDEADRRAALSLMPVSRETEELLVAYVDLLRRWQRVKNLVAPSTLDTIWTRHVADSAQLVRLAPAARHWVDLGSGAGFPGLVVAILLRDLDGIQVDLIESNERKGAFLREAIRVTGAPARVLVMRIDMALPKLQRPVDVVTSRALAPLPDLLAMGETLFDEGATGLFMVGGERTTPVKIEGYGLTAVPSLTKMASRIIEIRKSSPRV